MDLKAKERWRMLRCPGGPEDKTVIERIMLGFRPIAPKPATGGTASGNLQEVNKNLFVNNGRSKRKYVRVRKNNGYKRKNNKITSTDGNSNKGGLENKIVTLQLLPEKADLEHSKRREPWCNFSVDGTGKEREKDTEKVFFDNQYRGFYGMGGLRLSDQSQTVVMAPRKVVETWVTVESVISSDHHTCMDTRGLGREDVEIIKNLEKDKCPGFISDGSNKVKWVNGAYKRMVMVSKENEDSSAETTTIVVLLVMKEKLPRLFTSLTCKVRVEYTWQKEKYSKMVVPCDVWRMEDGGYAWRLDVEAALSLGR